MPEARFMSRDGTESRKVALDGPLFESEPNRNILHEYIKGYLRNQRQGTSCTLNRGRMTGGGRKPFRQKGTGRARAGTSNSPVWGSRPMILASIRVER